MSRFVNPTKSQKDVYVLEPVREDISKGSDVYEELKFRPDNVLNTISDFDPSDYTNGANIHAFSGYDSSLAEEVDSFTAPEIVEDLMTNSEVTGAQVDPDQGLIQINTYKTAKMESAWNFWIPYVDDVSGEIVGKIDDPYTKERSTFSHSINDPIDTQSCRDGDIADVAYILSRETVPEGPEVKTTTSTGLPIDENYLKGQYDILENNLGLISQLEESGLVQVDSNATPSANGFVGGDITKGLRKFLNRAKDARVIDYTVSNDNKENRVRINNGGYKHLTRNLSQLGFSDAQQLISSRTAPKWKNQE